MSVTDTLTELRAFAGGAAGYRAAGTSHLGLGQREAAELVERIDQLTAQLQHARTPQLGRPVRVDGSRPIGHIIRDLRLAAGLSRSELAQQVARRTGGQARSLAVLICRWESGRVGSPDVYLLNSTLSVFGLGLAFMPLPVEAVAHA